MLLSTCDRNAILDSNQVGLEVLWQWPYQCIVWWDTSHSYELKTIHMYYIALFHSNLTLNVASWDWGRGWLLQRIAFILLHPWSSPSIFMIGRSKEEEVQMVQLCLVSRLWPPSPPGVPKSIHYLEMGVEVTFPFVTEFPSLSKSWIHMKLC